MSLAIECPECEKEMLIQQDDGKILCVSCNKYFRIIPAEISVPGER